MAQPPSLMNLRLRKFFGSLCDPVRLRRRVTRHHVETIKRLVAQGWVHSFISDLVCLPYILTGDLISQRAWGVREASFAPSTRGTPQIDYWKPAWVTTIIWEQYKSGATFAQIQVDFPLTTLSLFTLVEDNLKRNGPTPKKRGNK